MLPFVFFWAHAWPLNGGALDCPLRIALAGIPPASNALSGGNNDSITHTSATWARTITPSDLMAMLEAEEHPELQGSKIIHQSWKNNNLPEDFELWSYEWRRLHPSSEGWLYVLWTDFDNRELMRRFYPHYLSAYDALPREIYRADMVRNAYMHAFGGVYADLDMLPLRSTSDNMPAIFPHSPSTANSSTSPADSPFRMAYLGRMGRESFEHSIPNAWMVSSAPGHPFWLRPLDAVLQYLRDADSTHLSVENEKTIGIEVGPEAVTGPVVLRKAILEWEDERESREANVRLLTTPFDVQPRAMQYWAASWKTFQ
ncbi:hypothetical protein PUNSTDRAFT_145072 [Punctularia strigosozonata HHB-11173 SS5]|uniref:uncharacterized protein n=1 Tax=Punctularia strigosozonata (strain HHB-11173) TaxID=741275 RepID=UPI00044180D6|nr:uncharacterized protein PUNSTDRAFT_145072 [Punctularia strigosozonata HHB-11173 SS5]EIN06486.1 hypothetical protein PUNSTDRAFT_145072 [Punctularia strigosozonata HHB-11173 SS5]